MSKIGNKKIEKIFVGTKETDSAYIGNNKIYSGEENLIGTWVFNNNITLLSDTTFTLEVYCNSVQVYKNFYAIAFNNTGSELRYRWRSSGGATGYYTTYESSRWNNTNYKTITISGGDDVNNPNAIAWFTTNATKQ